MAPRHWQIDPKKSRAALRINVLSQAPGGESLPGAIFHSGLGRCVVSLRSFWPMHTLRPFVRAKSSSRRRFGIRPTPQPPPALARHRQGAQGLPAQAPDRPRNALIPITQYSLQPRIPLIFARVSGASQDSRLLTPPASPCAERRRNMLPAQCSAAQNQRQPGKERHLNFLSFFDSYQYQLIATGQNPAYRITQHISQRMNSCAQPTTQPPNFRVPGTLCSPATCYWARTKELSIISTSKGPHPIRLLSQKPNADKFPQLLTNLREQGLYGGKKWFF